MDVHRPLRPRRQFILLSAGLILLATASVHAGNWPQILGPNRDGRAANERLATAWPAQGPRVVWERAVGNGFAGVAVAEGKAVLFHRLGDEELLEAHDAATGRILWKVGFPTAYRASISPDDGPLCVPVIHGNRVIAYGASGSLHAVDLLTGKKLWSRQALADFGAPEGYFGAGSAPIVEGDKVLVNVGGARQGAGIVAFALDTGKTVWKATDDQASYSAPTAVTLDGVRHIIFVTRLNALSLNPENGAIRFQFPFGQRGPTVNGATPLVMGDHLFLSASYGIGATYAKIDKSQATVKWNSDEIMSSQYQTCVQVDRFLFGIHGRQDQGDAALRCIDPAKQRVVWTEEGFGMGTLILADGKLLIVKTDGDIVLSNANPQKYEPLATAKIFSTTTRALPALSNGRLYLRDTQTLKCLDVGAGK